MKNHYELLSVREAAKLLAVSPTVLYKWRGLKIPYIKLGKSIRFLQSDIEAFIEKNRITSQKDYLFDANKIRQFCQDIQKEKIRKILHKVKKVTNNV